MNVRLLPRALCAATLLSLGLGPALAQSTSGWLEENRFQETEVKLPERFSTDRLIEFTVSSGSELRFGVDPQTVTVGTDRVVRYVLVARSPSGVVNVLYQGLRCDTGEFRTYALWQQPEGWREQRADWTDGSRTAAGLPAARLAREGLCFGRLPNTPVSKMLNELRYGRQDSNR